MADRELIARYGNGTQLPDDVPGEVIVIRHISQEAAEAFAQANRRSDCPAHAELREGVGWVDVIDLRPSLAAADAEYRESQAMSVTITAPAGVEDPAGQIRDAIREASRD